LARGALVQLNIAPNEKIINLSL
jgi:glycerol-3-phosphate O-acyltransferase